MRGFAAALASGTNAGNMASSSGSATAAPAPRKTVLLDSDFLVRNMALLLAQRRSHLKRRAMDHAQHECRESIVVARCAAQDGTNRRHVAVIEPTPQRIDEQLLSERSRKQFGTADQRIAQCQDAVHVSAVAKFTTGVDRIARIFAAPCSHGIEIL